MVLTKVIFYQRIAETLIVNSMHISYHLFSKSIYASVQATHPPEPYVPDTTVPPPGNNKTYTVYILMINYVLD